MSGNRLIVVTGPTASGKTRLAIDIAERLRCEIISADSRQMYRDISIGTAKPSPDELARVRHHFIDILPLDGYNSAACFEADAGRLLPSLFARAGAAVVCGGSMMYVDALVRGIDEMPAVSDLTRRRVDEMEAQHGVEGLLAYLEIIDPDYHSIVDRSNIKRVKHAIEISTEAGVPYSALRTGQAKARPYRIIKFMIDHPREELFERINRRVDAMMDAGLEDEARRVEPLRHLNSLNTVGYKEMFAWFDGVMDYRTAVERIKKNTRVYAKKQLTWLKRDTDVIRLNPATALDDAMAILREAD